MSVVKFNVNAKELIQLTYRLEKLRKSALPLAVKGTLNAAAFDVKTNTLQQSAKKNFIQRAPTFWKRFSSVNKVQSNDINSMRSEVGMTAQGQQRAKTPITNLQKQETGGSISKGLDYLAKSRRSASLTSAVAKAKYYSKGNTVRGKYKRPGTAASNAVAAAYMSLKTGKLRRLNKNGKNYYSKVTSIRSNKKGVKIKSQLYYISRTSSNSAVKATHFSKEAGQTTAKSIPRFFRIEADKQINKVWRK